MSKASTTRSSATPCFAAGARTTSPWTGQKLFPAVQLEDGRVIREESKDLAARIREGRLHA